jgi:small subunit ribosomal protein S6
MKQYELMTIYKNEVGDDGAKDLSKKVQDTVTSLSGKVVKNDFWGKRKFAYEIKHNKEGYYDVFALETEDSSFAEKLKGKLNLLNGLVRYLITAL